MAYRKVSSYSVPESRIERWLRYVFVEDWTLKLLALAIALALWFIKSGRS